LTATTTLGGKEGRAATAWQLVKARETFLKEALAPLADDLSRRIKAGGDDVVAETEGCEEDDLGSNDIPIR
jgi:hypothetical protein